MKLTDWLQKGSPSVGGASPGNGVANGASGGRSSLGQSQSQGQGSLNNSLSQNQNKMPPKEKKSVSTDEGGSKANRQSAGASSTSGTTTTVQGTHSCKHKQEVVLPQSKVKVIMKSSPEIDQVGLDVLFLITKATEIFIDHITTLTHNQAHKPKKIDYKHLADMTQKQPNLEFLRDIIPVKMLARDALKEVAKHKALANRELLGD